MNYVLLLGILLLLGLIATRVTRLIRLPNVTGYLVVGLLLAIIFIIIDSLGYTNPNYSESLGESLSTLNSFVSSIALGFIALSIGEEFKISKIKEYGSKMAIITILQALLATLLVDIVLAIVCVCLDVNMAVAICLGAIATATAPAATLMVIHQYKARGVLVDILLPVVAFDDALGLVVFAISLAIGKVVVTGEAISFVSIVLIPLLEIVGSLAVGFVLGILMHGLIKFFRSRSNHIIVIIAFTLLGVGTINALNHIKINGESLEFSNLLACMMIGAVYVNFTSSSTSATITRDIDLMDRWTGFLFTLFFVLSGASLATSAKSILDGNDITTLIPVLIIFVCYLIARSTGKYFGAYIGSAITRQPPVIKKYLGLTLLPQAGVAIGMANQISNIEVFKTNNIGNIIVTVVLCATLVYELVGPLITKWSLMKAHEIPSEENE